MALEAENAQLREELAAWKAYGGGRGGHRAGPLEREDRVKKALKAAVAGQPVRAAGQATRLLIHLIDHPGRIVSYDHVLALITDNEDAELTLVKVVAWQLRKALRAIGHSEALETVWGAGYRLNAAAAPAIAKALGVAE